MSMLSHDEVTIGLVRSIITAANALNERIGSGFGRFEPIECDHLNCALADLDDSKALKNVLHLGRRINRGELSSEVDEAEQFARKAQEFASVVVSLEHVAKGTDYLKSFALEILAKDATKRNVNRFRNGSCIGS